MVDAEAEGAGDGAFYGFEGDVEGPVGFFGEEGVDKGEVEPGFIGGDGVVSVGYINNIVLIMIVIGVRHGVILWRKRLIIKLAIN